MKPETLCEVTLTKQFLQCTVGLFVP